MAFIMELLKIICLFILTIAMILILVGAVIWLGLSVYSYWLDIVEEHDLDNKE